MESLQDRFGPDTICFGCGPANEQGLAIKGFPNGERVMAEFVPAPHHQAFPGVINGGILGTLLDCHMNWTAAWHLMNQEGLERPPVTVTAHFTVNLNSPTPAEEPLQLSATVVASTEQRVDVEGSISAGGEVTASGSGRFVAVEEGHPAYHRW